jgi:iduronate 2-sulfatase
MAEIFKLESTILANLAIQHMRFAHLCLLFIVALLSANDRPNVLLLCVDDLRPDLKSFGADYIHSPNIDRLAESGLAFHRHYTNAPTCGASRYTMLTGRYGPDNNQSLFKRAEQMRNSDSKTPPSMPEWFRKHGYVTVSVGKVSHHPGGWGGVDWDDKDILEMPGAWTRQLMPIGAWQHPRGAMHSLAHGEVRSGRSTGKNKMDAFQSSPGPDTIYHDGLIADEGEAQLEQLASGDQPFFLAIGLIKPHLPFGAPKAYMEPYEGVELPPIPHPEKPQSPSTWHHSGEFFGKYNHYGKDPRKDSKYADEVRRHYAACVSYADKQIGDILAKLKECGRDKDTIVVLWGDHGWHLGEHAIWGKHSLFEESLRSPLIISAPAMENHGQKTDAVVETADIFSTLCELANVPTPYFVDGRSLRPQLQNPDTPGHGAIAYRKDGSTIRTETHRLIIHKNGGVELYDHNSPEKETRNIAGSNPELVMTLARRIHERSPEKLSETLLEKLAANLKPNALQ